MTKEEFKGLVTAVQQLSGSGRDGRSRSRPPTPYRSDSSSSRSSVGSNGPPQYRCGRDGRQQSRGSRGHVTTGQIAETAGTMNQDPQIATTKTEDTVKTTDTKETDHQITNTEITDHQNIHTENRHREVHQKVM